MIHLKPNTDIKSVIADCLEPPLEGNNGEAAEDCLVFRTSLKDEEDVQRITHILDALPGMLQWSVDLDDCDNVLRVECSGLTAATIIEILQKPGVSIWEMPVDPL